jgi:hypothetical protein
MPTKTNAALSQRDALLQQMTEATKRLAVELDRRLTELHHEGLLARHDAGTGFACVIAEEATYGSDAVAQLAEYLGMSPDRIYKLRNYALERRAA